MLGYKKILWTSVFFAAGLFVGFLRFASVWADITTAALPDNIETAAFYYFVVTGLLGWHVGKVISRYLTWNRQRYNLEYELQVNNFFFHFTPMMAQKLNRHMEFSEFNKLLKLATKSALELKDVIEQERSNVR